MNTLASGQQTHSRLRSVIAEKGSRGAEIVDPLFEKVLKDVSSVHVGMHVCCYSRFYRSQTSPNLLRCQAVR